MLPFLSNTLSASKEHADKKFTVEETSYGTHVQYDDTPAAYVSQE